MLEYYDFIIFGLLAPYLAKNFFAQFSSPLSISYMLFAVGYLFRPFGGIILGMISDCKNREKIFTFIALLTGCSTFIMGCLPISYGSSSWPIYALIFLRICQSIGYGADIPNAATLIYERSITQQKNYYLSLVIINATIGALLAFFVLGLLTRNITEDAMYEYGWRIPLILGGVLTMMVYFARKSLFRYSSITETSVDENKIKYTCFLKNLLFSNYKELFIYLFITFSSAVFVITNIYLPNYLSEFFGYTKGDILTITTFGLVLCIPILFFSGKYLNKNAGKNIFLLIGFLVISSILYIIMFGKFANIYQVWFFVIISYVYNCYTITYGLKMAMGNFDKQVRNTSVAVIYNGAFVIASLLPNLTIGLNNMLNNRFIVLYILLIVVVSAMFTCQKFISSEEM